MNLMLSVSHRTTMHMAIDEAVQLWEVAGWTVRVGRGHLLSKVVSRVLPTAEESSFVD